MGDAADDAFNAALHASEFYDFDDGEALIQRSPVGKYQWRDRLGKVWHMNDMSDSHIQNCMRICRAVNNSSKLTEFHYILAQRSINPPVSEYDTSYKDFLKRIGET